MSNFHLQIVTPDGLIFDGLAECLHVKADSGDIEIMKSHADYFSSLGVGRAKITVDGKDRAASCSGGFVSVRGGQVKLVATTFEFAEDIDVKRAMLAKDRAEEAIKAAQDKRSAELAKAKLLRAINRINVSELK